MLKQKSVLFTWGLSYCVLLLLLVMFCTVLNVSAQAQLLVEYKQITRSLQQQANQAINEYFNSMEARAYNLANDYLINTFSSLTDPYGASYYHLLPIQQKLRYELLAAQEDVEIYLYSQNIDRALSSKTILTQNDLYNVLYPNATSEKADFLRLLTDFHYNEFYVAKQGQHTANNMLLLTSVPLVQRSTKALIIQELRGDALRKILQKNLVIQGATSVLMNPQGEIVCAVGDEALLVSLQQANLSDMAAEEITLDEEAFWIQQDTMNQTDWKIVTVLPMSAMRAKSAWITPHILLFLAIFLGLGILCSAVLLRMNYAPIKQLRQWFPKGEKHGNEFLELAYTLRNMRSDLERMETLQQKQTTYLQKEFLTSCLDHALSTESERTDRLLQHLDMRFSGDWFAVLLLEFVIEDERNLLATRDRFLAELGESTGNDFCVYYLETGEKDALVFNFQNKKSGTEIFGLVLESLTAIGKENPSWGLRVQGSGVLRGLEQIHLAHLDACEAMMRERLLSEGQKARGSAAVMTFPHEQKQLLLRYLKAKNAQEAHAVLERVYAQNLRSEALSMPVCRCLSSDIITGALRAFEQEPEFYRKIEEMLCGAAQKCARAQNREALIQITDAAVDSLLSLWVSESEQAGTEKAVLLDKIMQYVDVHYLEHDFSVSAIADSLNIHVTYLSKYFKAQTGIGLLNYVNGLRINYAKRLIAQEHISVTQAADRAGFDNANTFIRLFKKYEGITPGMFGNF